MINYGEFHVVGQSLAFSCCGVQKHRSIHFIPKWNADTSLWWKMADFKAADVELFVPCRTKLPEVGPEKHICDLPEHIPVELPVEWEWRVLQWFSCKPFRNNICWFLCWTECSVLVWKEGQLRRESQRPVGTCRIAFSGHVGTGALWAERCLAPSHLQLLVPSHCGASRERRFDSIAGEVIEHFPSSLTILPILSFWSLLFLFPKIPLSQ